jgi:hypothetical protein
VDRAGLLDDPRVQRQRLGQRRLAGVGVADDAKCGVRDGLGGRVTGCGGDGGGHGHAAYEPGRRPAAIVAGA